MVNLTIITTNEIGRTRKKEEPQHQHKDASWLCNKQEANKIPPLLLTRKLDGDQKIKDNKLHCPGKDKV